jgi:capsular polysaccharide biosynthesis protein
LGFGDHRAETGRRHDCREKNAVKTATTDAVGTLRWGLRRYRTLFVLCFLLGAVLAPLAALQRTTPIDAEALVVAQRLDMSLIALPRYGQEVFDNGQVAQAVAAKFGDKGSYADIVPDRVSVVADQDSIIFHVVGHDPNPQVAAEIANTAAGVYITALNAPGVGVGQFALQSPATPPPAQGHRLSTLLAIPVGLAAGLVLGLAVVSILLVARRPVIGSADAEEATGVPALGTVTVPRTRGGSFARPDEFSGLVPVCRRLLALPTTTIVLASRPREDKVRQQLSIALASVLMRVREVRLTGPSALQSMAADRGAASGPAVQHHRAESGEPAPVITLVDSNEPLDLVQPPRSTATVLVVPEGISGTALRAAVVEHLGGSAEARLLLTRRGRRSRGETMPTLQDASAKHAPEAISSPSADKG